jgi:hypothetical protein
LKPTTRPGFILTGQKVEHDGLESGGVSDISTGSPEKHYPDLVISMFNSDCAPLHSGYAC